MRREKSGFLALLDTLKIEKSIDKPPSLILPMNSTIDVYIALLISLCTIGNGDYKNHEEQNVKRNMKKYQL